FGPEDERQVQLQPAKGTVYETPQIPDVIQPSVPSIDDSQFQPIVKRRNWAWVVALAAVVVAAGVWIAVAGRHASDAPNGPSTEPKTSDPAKAGPVTGSTRVNPKDGLTYVWIAPGTFTMGCSPGDNECSEEERPAHQVTITKGVWIGQTAVTQAAYERLIGSNRSHH